MIWLWKVSRAVAFAVAMLPMTSQCDELRGTVTIIDGDTIKIGEVKVRLFGIDAPEGKQRCQRDGLPWLCGQEAGKFLRALIASQEIICLEQDRDRYGRTVATCALQDGRDIGAEMVRAGMALAYRRYGGEIYDGAEIESKGEKRGLWAGVFVPPWEWRKVR